MNDRKTKQIFVTECSIHEFDDNGSIGGKVSFTAFECEDGKKLDKESFCKLIGAKIINSKGYETSGIFSTNNPIYISAAGIGVIEDHREYAMVTSVYVSQHIRITGEPRFIMYDIPEQYILLVDVSCYNETLLDGGLEKRFLLQHKGSLNEPPIKCYTKGNVNVPLGVRYAVYALSSFSKKDGSKMLSISGLYSSEKGAVKITPLEFLQALGIDVSPVDIRPEILVGDTEGIVFYDPPNIKNHHLVRSIIVVDAFASGDIRQRIFEVPKNISLILDGNYYNKCAAKFGLPKRF